MVHCDECGPSSPVSCVSEFTDSKVVIVGLPDSDPGIIDAFEAGALGYLSLHGQSAEDIRRVIATVAAGEAALDPKLSANVLARMRRLHVRPIGGWRGRSRPQTASTTCSACSLKAAPTAR